MSTILERRRLGQKSSAGEVLHAADFRSPLAQVRSMANALPDQDPEAGPSTSRRPAAQPSAQAVPALDFNLFRSNSVYSVSSVNTFSSFDTSSEDHATGTFFPPSDAGSSSGSDTPPSPPLPAPIDFSARVETPTTPKAERAHYFDLGPPVTATLAQEAATRSAEDLSAGQTTPRRSFFVRSRQGHVNPPPLDPVHLAQLSQAGPGPSTSTSRLLSETHQDVFTSPARGRADSITRGGEIAAQHPQRRSIGLEDWESVHGEQGSEWGDDEAGFEWLDTDGAPAALNGHQPERVALGLSPGKRFAKLREAVPGFSSGGSGAAGDGHVVGGRKLKKQHIIMPRRAAPPPPPGPGSPRQPTQPPLTIVQPSQSGTRPDGPSVPPPTSKRPAIPVQTSLPNIRAQEPQRQLRQGAAQAPTMMPVRDPSPLPGPVFSRIKGHNSRNSALSIQSNAFSLYDLDGLGASSPSFDTPRASTPGGGEMVFPKGTYTKVSASALARSEEDGRRRMISEPGRAPPRSPLLDPRNASQGDLLAKGVEARGKGDLPKAAWYFRQAADAGSMTGRIYWGLALRHGWGVARDERKAFAELRTACDGSIAQGSVQLPVSSESGQLSIQQKKAVARDISLGMFEVANCFLDGVGVKKDSEVAVSYLRFAGDLGDLASQEQLGFLLSKGGNGIKKDMKEAAKWYRMALGQGSSTMGLAWVWKEKYMT